MTFRNQFANREFKGLTFWRRAFLEDMQCICLVGLNGDSIGIQMGEPGPWYPSPLALNSLCPLIVHNQSCCRYLSTDYKLCHRIPSFLHSTCHRWMAGVRLRHALCCYRPKSRFSSSSLSLYRSSCACRTRSPYKCYWSIRFQMSSLHPPIDGLIRLQPVLPKCTFHSFLLCRWLWNISSKEGELTLNSIDINDRSRTANETEYQ